MSTPQDCKSTVCADNVPTPQAVEPWSDRDLSNGYRYRDGSKVYCCAASAWEAGHSDDCASKRAAPLQPAAAPSEPPKWDWRGWPKTGRTPAAAPEDAATATPPALTQWGPILDALDSVPNDLRDEFEELDRLIRKAHADTLDALDAAAPEDAAGMGALPHSDESVERAFIALREMVQARNGWGMSAVFTVEEQLKAALAASGRAQQGAPVAMPEPPDKDELRRWSEMADDLLLEARPSQRTVRMAAYQLQTAGRFFAALAGLQAGRDADHSSGATADPRSPA